MRHQIVTDYFRCFPKSQNTFIATRKHFSFSLPSSLICSIVFQGLFVALLDALASKPRRATSWVEQVVATEGVDPLATMLGSHVSTMRV